MNSVQSPTYILDEALLQANLEKIYTIANEAGITIIPALKAFANWKMFPYFKQFVKGAAASSIFEAQLIYDHMQVYAHAYSPAYKISDIPVLNKYCSHITFNSLQQFNSLKEQVYSNIKIGLRVNPEISIVETDLYNPCSPGSRLGIQKEKLQIIPEEVSGLHVHALCESTHEGSITLMQNTEKLYGHLFKNISWINFGGGHLFTHKNYNTRDFINYVRAFKERYPHLELIFEPGSAFVWQTGNLLSTVIDIVDNKGIFTAILDVSFTAHMPDCLEMPYKPGVIESTNTKTQHSYRLGGNSCLAGDFIGDWYFDKPLQIGDTITFTDMIHYTTVKTTMFNGVHHPSLSIKKIDGSFEVLREFGYSDFKSRMG